VRQDTLSIVLLSVFILCAVGVIAVVIWLLRLNSTTRLRGRVDKFVGQLSAPEDQYLSTAPMERESRYDRFEGMRGRVNRALSSFSTDALRQKISSAYWPISDIEFVFIRIAVTLLGFALGWVIPQSIIGGIGLGLLFYLIPGFVLDRSIANRRKKFQDQLLDFLILIKGAVLAGFSLPQSIEMAIKEVPAPASEEFGRVLREVRFGFPLDQALFNLANRIQSDDLQIVVTAIVLNSQVGGNLSTILEATIDTVRERIHLFSEVRSLTSYARYTGSLISFLPFLTALVIFLVNPGYFDTVKTSLVAQLIFAAALLSIVVGNVIIRQIVRIRV